MKTKTVHTGNNALFIIMAGVYVGVLILFGVQTWLFVDWLFPADQLFMKLMTVLCFDVMSFLWAVVDLFYDFASVAAKRLVQWAWGISFLLSLTASIFYLSLESMFRFHVTVTADMVNTGYGVVIFAVTLTVVFLTAWLYIEWDTRHPQVNGTIIIEEKSQPAQLPPPQKIEIPAPQPSPEIEELKQVIKQMSAKIEAINVKERVPVKRATKKKVTAAPDGNQIASNTPSNGSAGSERDSTSQPAPGATPTK